MSSIDIDLLQCYLWSYSGGKFNYAKRFGTVAPGVYKTIKLHQEIAKRAFGDIGGYDIDHINRNVLDNRRENLRIATRSENRHNTILKSDGGVHQLPSGSWIALISVRGRQRYGGAFATKEEALAKRKRMEFSYLGHLIEREV